MKYLFFTFLFIGLISCGNDTPDSIDNTSNSDDNGQETIKDSKEPGQKSQLEIPVGHRSEDETEEKLDPVHDPLTNPYASYEIIDEDFANHPFTISPQDLKKTLYSSPSNVLDTMVYRSKTKAGANDSIFTFYYSHADIGLYYLAEGDPFIAFARLKGNGPLYFKYGLRIGMTKDKFYTALGSALDNVTKEYNLFRISEARKLKWIGIQFLDGKLIALEYRGHLD